MTPFIIDPTQTQNAPHVGDIGSQFIVTIYNQNSEVQNLSSATNILFKFLSPSREATEKEGSLYTDGSDGKIIYITEDGDLNEAGLWSYQIFLEFGVGAWSTNIEQFTLYSNIEIPIP